MPLGPRPLSRRLAPLGAGLLATAAVTASAVVAGPWAALAVAVTAGLGVALVLLGILRRYRSQAQTFFDAVCDAVLLLEPGTERVLDANRAACVLYGYARGEIVGLSARTFSDDPTGGDDAVGRLLTDGGAIEFDSAQRRRDGTPLRVRIRATLTRIGGRPVLVSVNRDVTEQWQAEAGLQAALAHADRLAHVLAQTADGVIVTDAEGRAVWVNEAMTRISGYTAAEILGHRPADVMQSPETDAGEAARVAACVAAREPFTAERLNRRPDGVPYWVHLSCAPLVEDGQFAGYVAIETDVTERTRAEAALRESEARFRLVTETAGVGLFVSDVEAGQTTFTFPARAVIGYDEPEPFTFARFNELVHPDDRAAVAAAVAQAKDPAGSGRAELAHRVVRPDTGEARWVSVRIEAVFDGEGAARRVVKLCGVLLDATEQKRATAALRESEEQLQTLLATVDDVLWATPLDGSAVLFLSAAAERLYGRPHAELVADPAFWTAAVHPDDRARVEEASASLFEAGAVEDEYRIVRPDGSVRWVGDRRWVVRDPAGAPVRLGGIVTDVTDRREAIAALALQEERFRALVHHSSDIVTVLSGAGQILYESPAVEGVLGYTPEDLVGRSAFEFVHDDDATAVGTAFATAASSPGRAVPVTFRWRHADGSWVDLEAISTNRLTDPAIGGIVVNSRDVRASLRYEAEREARERAEEMLRLKSAFLNNMSHELRTPLTGILGFAEVLADEVGEAQQDCVEAILRGGQRLLTTLNSVLDLAQLESGSVRVEPEPVDVLAEAREVCELLGSVARAKGLDLAVAPEGRPVVASANRAALYRVLMNLVGNAVKFTEAGTVDVEVGASVGTAWARVCDTGIGISPEELPHVFDEFRQVSEGYNRSHEGNGLGLTIVRRLVSLMGGTIEVESALGVGTAFTVTLPAAPGAAALPASALSAPASRRPPLPATA